MYQAVRQVEITFPLDSDGPGSVLMEPGETFEIETYERSGYEWDVMVFDGERYTYPRWKDIRQALECGDLVEV